MVAAILLQLSQVDKYNNMLENKLWRKKCVFFLVYLLPKSGWIWNQRVFQQVWSLLGCQRKRNCNEGTWFYFPFNSNASKRHYWNQSSSVVVLEGPLGRPTVTQPKSSSCALFSVAFIPGNHKKFWIHSLLRVRYGYVRKTPSAGSAKNLLFAIIIWHSSGERGLPPKQIF